MKVTVYIATTINGQINADVPHDEWISEASWRAYLATLQSLDAAIVGGKTYGVMADEEFPEGLQFEVLTHHADDLPPRPGVHFSADAAEVVIKRLAASNCQQVGILGGAEVISEYLGANVVDELVIDIQAVLNQPKKNLIVDGFAKQSCTLVEVKQLDNQTVQLRYRVGSTS